MQPIQPQGTGKRFADSSLPTIFQVAVVGGQIDDAPAGKGTAVVDAAGIQLQGVGADEAAGAVEIAGAGEDVDFG